MRFTAMIGLPPPPPPAGATFTACLVNPEYTLDQSKTTPNQQPKKPIDPTSAEQQWRQAALTIGIPSQGSLCRSQLNRYLK